MFLHPRALYNVKRLAICDYVIVNFNINWRGSKRWDQKSTWPQLGIVENQPETIFQWGRPAVPLAGKKSNLLTKISIGSVGVKKTIIENNYNSSKGHFRSFSALWFYSYADIMWRFQSPFISNNLQVVRSLLEWNTTLPCVWWEKHELEQCAVLRLPFTLFGIRQLICF